MKMTNEQIQTRIDIALDLLDALPVLALAQNERLSEFVDDYPYHIKFLESRRAAGLPDRYKNVA